MTVSIIRAGEDMKTARVVLAVSCLVALSWFASAFGDEVKFFSRDNPYILGDGLQLAMGPSPDVPYVSTPYEMANEMIRLAGVTANDVVYDLGCGDGRLVIEAVKKAGCRGVGVDIDPERVKESRAYAVRAGVQDRVRFVEQNFFATDIREATVMLIYLFPDINIRLRAKFLGEMRPGSRLVSHAFDMGDWRPDVTSNILAQRVYLWVIPTNVSGIWTWKAPGKGQASHTLEIEQRYQQIRGTLSAGGHAAALSDPKIAGDRVSFAIEQDLDGVKTRREFTGTVRGNAITGTIVSRQGGRVQNARWKAVRDPSTQRPVETGYQRTDLLWN